MSELTELILPKYKPKGKTRFLMGGRVFEEMQREVSLEDILQVDKTFPDQVIWIDIQAPDETVMKHMESKFCIHPLTVEDILSTDHREKIEVFDKYVLAMLKEIHFADGSNYLVISTISILVYSNIVLTFHEGPLEPIEQTFRRLKHHIGAIDHEKCLKSSDWTLYAVLDAVIDNFASFVNSIIGESEALDDLVLIFHSDDQEDFLRRIGLARKQMLMLRSQLWSKREILEVLVNKSHIYIHDSTKVYFRDVLDHVMGMNERLHIAQELLNNVNSTYLSRVSLEVSESGNRMNKIMFNFGMVATIFLPLNLLAGMMGMNVKVPGRDVDNLDWFLSIIGFMIALSLILLSLFKCVKWILQIPKLR